MQLCRMYSRVSDAETAARIYMFRLRCASFRCSTLVRKANYKFSGLPLWQHRFAAICRVGCDSNTSTLWISSATQFIPKKCLTVPFSLLYYLFTFFLPIIYRRIIPPSIPSLMLFLLSLIFLLPFYIKFKSITKSCETNISRISLLFLRAYLIVFSILKCFLFPSIFLLLFSIYLFPSFGSPYALSCSHCFSFMASPLPPAFTFLYFQ
jgi:hypothetical protein